ncbi:MAG TPA: calcium-translocating P-type ATPase, PMCA-type [Clostridiales bacterium]|nr:calcium-translocating P-type ATPase, PMCA-type [Clostridiales bacterium]
MNWHSVSIKEALMTLNVTADKGLNSQEIMRRQKTFGMNVLNEKKSKPLIYKFILQFADFMIITLLFAAFISFFGSYLEGNPNYIEPSIILIIITLNAILGVVHESKAERSLEALKKMSAPNAHVIRNGIIVTVEASDLVPGDIILLETGHFVPADAKLITSINLKVEESSLTGESDSVEKHAENTLKPTTNMADRNNLVMATTVVTYGRGTAVVTHTGMDTQVGHIAKLIMKDEPSQTPLQKRLGKIGKYLGVSALIICIVIFIIGVAQKSPIFDMFMTSVSLAVAAIPEGLPAIVTIMLSIGVQRMAKKNAVIRKLPAVETLGSATVICSDKTGTLTQNIMTVTNISSINGYEKFDSPFGKFLFSNATLCNDSVLQIVDKKELVSGEPTENALITGANNIGIKKNIIDLSYKRVNEIPFDSTRKLMTTIHKAKNKSYISITKGAYDFLINKCSTIYNNGDISPLTNIERRKINKLNKNMTQNALRVIAVAYKSVNSNQLKSDSNIHENDLCFVGLIGMIDPPRIEVRDSVKLCKQAGIKPVMITGDHVLTAKAIAKELGILSNKDMAMTGEELSNINDKELTRIIHNYTVFARVSPEHKVRIVKAFQNRGEIVAMTGDGVNDAPALKAADIGCAMGITGTDVTKSAADMILTDDNFATIVSAVKEGRGIYDNIKKSIHFLLSCNIGEIITIFIAILFGLPTPLLAVQLLWVNLVTDSLPAISLGVEPVENDVMKRNPIPPGEGLFAHGLMYKIIFEGILIGSLSLTAFVIGVRYYDVNHLINPVYGRTMAFAVLSISQLFHSFNMKSNHSLSEIGIFSNTKLVLSFIICLFLQIIVISVSSLAKIFQVSPLNIQQWGIVFLLSFVPIIILEFQKSINNHKTIK